MAYIIAGRCGCGGAYRPQSVVWSAGQFIREADQLLVEARESSPYFYVVDGGLCVIACPGDRRCQAVLDHVLKLVEPAYLALCALRRMETA